VRCRDRMCECLPVCEQAARAAVAAMGGVSSAVGLGKLKPQSEYESFFDMSAMSTDRGGKVEFSEFAEHVLLIANVASK